MSKYLNGVSLRSLILGAPSVMFMASDVTGGGNGKRGKKDRQTGKQVLGRGVFHVHVALDDYAVGDALDADQHADYLIALYNETSEEDTELDTAQVRNLSETIEGDSQEADIARIELITNESEVEDVEEANMSAARSSGFGFGAKLDAEANAHMYAVADAKEVQDGSVLLLALDDERCYTVEERAEWPEPYSSWDDAERVEAASKGRNMPPPDHYKDGKVRGSFYADKIDGSAFGKHCAAVKQCLEKIKAKEALNDKEENLMRAIGYPNWRALNDGDLRETEVKRWSARRANMVVRSRRAAMYLRHKDEMVEAIDGLEVQLQQKPDMIDNPLEPGEKMLNPASPILRKTNCLRLVWSGLDVNKKRETIVGSPLSIMQFNRMLIDDKHDEKKNKTNHGALFYISQGLTPISALEKTIERPARRKGSKAEGLTIPTANVNGKQASVMVTGLASFFDDAKKDAKLTLALAGELAGDNAKHSILTMGDTIEALKEFFAPYDRVYQSAVQDRLIQIQKETTERLARERLAQDGGVKTPAQQRTGM